MSIISALMNRNKIYSFEDAFGVKDITSDEMRNAIELWLEMYFENDKKQLDDCQRLPVLIVKKLTKTAFSEYQASSKNEFANCILRGTDVIHKKAFQQMLISGECLIKPVPTADGFTFVPIRRDCFVPLARNENEELTSVGTAEITIAKGKYYTLLERRTAGKMLIIESKLYESETPEMLGTEIPVNALEKYENLQPVIALPLSGLGLIHLKTPLLNTVDGSADSVAIYAPAAKLIQRINRNEKLLDQEFELGRLRIMVPEDLMCRRSNGVRRLEDDVFTSLAEDPDEQKITTFSPQLRESSYLARKTEYLRNIESLIGFKRGILSDVEMAERTATEITSSDGDYNLTITDLQEVWERAVRDAVQLCSELARIYKMPGAAKVNDEDVIIDFGDGVLYNRDKTWNEYCSMVQMGLIKPEIAVAWYFELPHETEHDIEEIRRQYMPEIESMTREE